MEQIGRYKSQKVLGAGGMAIVYLAFDPKLGRQVAIKILKENLVSNKKMRNQLIIRFSDDAKLAAQLDHPNIIDVYDIDVDETGQYYITMRYISTEMTLQKLLRKNGALSPELAVKLLASIADALDHAHQNAVIHRDVKPANILINELGNPILCDFGIAHIKREEGSLTMPGMILGSVPYMSPEQVQAQPVQRQADIYSLGVVLYETVTGQVPFNGEKEEIKYKHVYEAPAFPSSINSDIPDAIKEIILKAMAKKPQDRFESAAEMAQDMRNVFPSEALDSVNSIFLEMLRRDDSKFVDKPKETPSYSDGQSTEKVQRPSSTQSPTEEVQKKTIIDTFDSFIETIKNTISRLLMPKQSTRFLIYYLDDEESSLANYLSDFLASEGKQVFIESSTSVGMDWAKKIEQRLRVSDFLLLLISPESAYSEMMHEVVERAYEHHKLHQQPYILPVRINYEDAWPYPIDDFLEPQEYLVWQSPADNEQVGQEILAAIQGSLSPRPPILPRLRISQNGSGENPLPNVDPRFLQELEFPAGPVTPNDKFYIERAADAELRRQLAKEGTLTTIRAGRQTGKSSLLVRGIAQAKQNADIVYIDLQALDKDTLKDKNRFLHNIAKSIVRKLQLNVDVGEVWQSSLGPQDKLTILLEDYILPQSDKPLMLAMDEVDRLLETSLFYTDFFALLRSWHNNRAFDEQWVKLNMILVISTEPHLLIADINQSPFNVGLRLNLKDFNERQVRDLNQRYHSPVEDREIHLLIKLLNGQPYLTRKALYTLVKESWYWADLTRVAETDQGPFRDHLQRYRWLLNDKKDLKAGLKQVIQHNRCSDEIIFYRLMRAGLVQGTSDSGACRCDLYRRYFKRIL